MQVVYNNQFGGFGLSDEALSLLSERKGVKFDEYLASELPRHDPDLKLLKIKRSKKYEKN